MSAHLKVQIFKYLYIFIHIKMSRMFIYLNVWISNCIDITCYYLQVLAILIWRGKPNNFFMLRTNLGFRARRCRGETRTCTHQSSVFSRRWSRVIFTWQTRFKSEEQFTEVRTYTIMPLPAKIINKLGFKQIIFLLLQVQVSHGHLDQ